MLHNCNNRDSLYLFLTEQLGSDTHQKRTEFLVEKILDILEPPQSQSMADNTKEGFQWTDRLVERYASFIKIAPEFTIEEFKDSFSKNIIENLSEQSPTPVSDEEKDVRNLLINGLYFTDSNLMERAAKEIYNHYKDIIEPLKKENELLREQNKLQSEIIEAGLKSCEDLKDKIKAMQSEINNLVEVGRNLFNENEKYMETLRMADDLLIKAAKENEHKDRIISELREAIRLECQNQITFRRQADEEIRQIRKENEALKKRSY